MSSDSPSSTEMSPDLVFDILSNTRRRMVLYYLRQYGEPTSVQKLAEEIAALENDVAVDELTQQQRKRVYVSLYQTHLPKLEETGVIEYDDDRDEVHLTDRVVEIDTYLTPTTESEYPWQLHYLVLAIVGGATFVLSSLGVPVLAAVSTVELGSVLIVAFAISAVVQYWRYQQRQREIPAELLEHEG
ncbi:DUF7344 domain-containing protein [Halopenitus persicus]|uniref:DUF7344 domain-containing protein n=1 Tax=Halopenitus persicus TaxID=1048396 RepID=UPI000BBB26B5|nr:hypothetical protein [Halopenitus persicus]